MLLINKEIHSISNLVEISHILCDFINCKSVLMLEGELGVGKTTLSSYILKKLVDQGKDYTSPTFNLVHQYYSQLKKCEVYHLDLYRLKDQEEIKEIGFSDMLNNGIVIIEWPEIAFPILKRLSPDRLIMTRLSFCNENARHAVVMSPCKME